MPAGDGDLERPPESRLSIHGWLSLAYKSVLAAATCRFEHPPFRLPPGPRPLSPIARPNGTAEAASGGPSVLSMPVKEVLVTKASGEPPYYLVLLIHNPVL